VRFWDASAIVPLCVEQPLSVAVDHERARDPEMIVWWATAVECASGFARLEREGVLAADGIDLAFAVLGRLERSWYEVEPSAGLRNLAMQLLRLHTLRAADALQLAAALEWSGRPGSGDLITYDVRLAEAARREGFIVVGSTP